jgi:hypothetical protein
LDCHPNEAFYWIYSQSWAAAESQALENQTMMIVPMRSQELDEAEDKAEVD